METKGDGIPNILSDDNAIVDGVRQSPITQKIISSWCIRETTNF
jgi:hypothetical protein